MGDAKLHVSIGFFLGGGGGLENLGALAATNLLASVFCRAQLIPTQADRPTRMCPWRRRRRAAGRRGSSRPPSSWRGQRSLSLAAIYEQSTPHFTAKLPKQGQTSCNKHVVTTSPRDPDGVYSDSTSASFSTSPHCCVCSSRLKESRLL